MYDTKTLCIVEEYGSDSLTFGKWGMPSHPDSHSTKHTVNWEIFDVKIFS